MSDVISYIILAVSVPVTLYSCFRIWQDQHQRAWTNFWRIR